MSKKIELPDYLKKFLIKIESETSLEKQDNKIIDNTTDEKETPESDERQTYSLENQNCIRNSFDKFVCEREVECSKKLENQLYIRIEKNHQNVNFDDLEEIKEKEYEEQENYSQVQNNNLSTTAIVKYKEGFIIKTSCFYYNITKYYPLSSIIIFLKYLTSFLKDFFFILSIKKSENIRKDLLYVENLEEKKSKEMDLSDDEKIEGESKQQNELYSDKNPPDKEYINKRYLKEYPKEEMEGENISDDLENIKKNLTSCQEAIESINLSSEKLEMTMKEQKNTLENLLQEFEGMKQKQLKMEEFKESQQKLLEQIQNMNQKNIDSILEIIENLKKTQVQKNSEENITETLKTFKKEIQEEHEGFENTITNEIKTTKQKIEEQRITFIELLNNLNEHFQTVRKNISENFQVFRGIVTELKNNIENLNTKLENLEERIEKKEANLSEQTETDNFLQKESQTEKQTKNRNIPDRNVETEKRNNSNICELRETGETQKYEKNSSTKSCLTPEKIQRILRVVKTEKDKKKVFLIRKRDQQN
jgi:hypothetical protein